MVVAVVVGAAGVLADEVLELDELELPHPASAPAASAAATSARRLRAGTASDGNGSLPGDVYGSIRMTRRSRDPSRVGLSLGRGRVLEHERDALAGPDADAEHAVARLA